MKYLFSLFMILAFLPPLQAGEAGFEKAKLAWTLKWDVDWVQAVAYVGPNRIAAGNKLGQILIWDLPTDLKAPAPKPIKQLVGHTNEINRLLVSPDGKWLYSASNDHTIRKWDLKATGNKKEKVVLNARLIYDAESRKKKPPVPVEAEVECITSAKVLDGHHDWVLGLTQSKDGKILISGDDKGEIVVWDREAEKELRRWKVKGWVWAMSLAPEADLLVVSERIPLVFDSGRHAGVKTWDPRKGEVKDDWSKAMDKQIIGAAAFSPDGKFVVLGRGGEADVGGGGKLTVYSRDGKKLKDLTPGHAYGVTDLLFHPDGEHLFSSGRDTVVKIWNLKSGKMVKELGTPRGGQFKDWIHATSLSADQKWLAAADMAGQVQIWMLK